MVGDVDNVQKGFTGNFSVPEVNLEFDATNAQVGQFTFIVSCYSF